MVKRSGCDRTAAPPPFRRRPPTCLLPCFCSNTSFRLAALSCARNGKGTSHRRASCSSGGGTPHTRTHTLSRFGTARCYYYLFLFFFVLFLTAACCTTTVTVCVLRRYLLLHGGNDFVTGTSGRRPSELNPELHRRVLAKLHGVRRNHLAALEAVNRSAREANDHQHQHHRVEYRGKDSRTGTGPPGTELNANAKEAAATFTQHHAGACRPPSLPRVGVARRHSVKSNSHTRHSVCSLSARGRGARCNCFEFCVSSSLPTSLPPCAWGGCVAVGRAASSCRWLVVEISPDCGPFRHRSD